MPDFDKQAVEKAEACLAEEDYNGAKEALSEIEGEDAEKLLNYINAAVNFDVGIPYAAFKELGDYKDAKLYTEYYKCFYELDESKIADAVKSPLHTQKRASRIFEHCKYSSRTTFAEALKILAFRNTYIELTGEEALSSHDRSITQDTELTMSELVSALPPSDGGKVVIIKSITDYDRRYYTLSINENMELSKELHPLKTEDISWIIEEAYESVRVGTYTNTAAATRVDGRVHVYKAGSMEPGYSSATVEGDPPPSVLHYKGAGTGFQPNLDNELKDALRYIAGE